MLGFICILCQELIEFLLSSHCKSLKTPYLMFIQPAALLLMVWFFFLGLFILLHNGFCLSLFCHILRSECIWNYMPVICMHDSEAFISHHWSHQKCKDVFPFSYIALNSDHLSYVTWPHVLLKEITILLNINRTLINTHCLHKLSFISPMTFNNYWLRNEIFSLETGSLKSAEFWNVVLALQSKKSSKWDQSLFPLFLSAKWGSDYSQNMLLKLFTINFLSDSYH